MPVASFTVTKLRWLAENEPASAARTAAVCLPHDWLTWKLAGATDGRSLTTDRSDASGTGYWSPATGTYRPDLLRLALGREPDVPAVLDLNRPAGHAASGALLGPGAGDNAAAALGVGAAVGDVVVSIGTSGVVCAVSPSPTADPTGIVAGFASATGEFLPLVCTLNAARVLDSAAAMLQVDHVTLSELALKAPPGPMVWSSCLISKENAPPIGPTQPVLCTDSRCALARPPTSPGPRSRVWCADLRTVLTPWKATVPASIASSWWVAAHDPRRYGESPRRYSATRWPFHHPVSTWRTEPPSRPPGH